MGRLGVKHRASGYALITCIAAATACNGSGTRQTVEDFQVLGFSVSNGATWQLNRPLDVHFNHEVDFATVSFNTLRITTLDGETAIGSFAHPVNANGTVDRTTVRFQATCPTLPDHSNGGLRPGGETYLLAVPGSAAGGSTLRSAAGDQLAEGASVTFSTPISNDPKELFVDPVSGPPRPRLRGVAGVAPDELQATYVESARSRDGERAYIVWNGEVGRLEEGELSSGLPLNHYSLPENRMALVVFFDQPILASENNLMRERIGLEYRPLASPADPWRPVPVAVELAENCTETGASVRIEPLGILPQASELRLRLAEFSDLSGDRTGDEAHWLRLVTASSADPAAGLAAVEVDELLERFAVGAAAVGSLEDPDAEIGLPAAEWGAGALRASFDFPGTGGPGGDFDWVLAAGANAVLDTALDEILGGPGGFAAESQRIVGGVVDVRDLIVPAGATLTIQGPNTCTILASGRVEIHGRISIDGNASQGVGSVGTTILPEPGAAGQGGGGAGGAGSFGTASSTPRGVNGQGPFGEAGGGGQGGESGYAPEADGVDSRRGAGGGGGRFGPDVRYPFGGTFIRCQTLIGMDAEPGFGGGTGAGAEGDGATRPMGGAFGRSPFFDPNPANDFWGTLAIDDSPGERLLPGERLVIGELGKLMAGAGGGGGGDASSTSTWPMVPFDPAGDEKGSGGGGGAGGLAILAVGPIIVHDGGSITANGGHGGGGESTAGFNRVGGGSGGGSGGHIVLSSASFIEVGGRAANAGAFYADPITGHRRRALSALGGQGGAGHGNSGGAKHTGVTVWRADAIPLAYFEGLTPPPLSTPGYDQNSISPDFSDPLGPTLGAGGDGGPGLIQLHVDDPARNLRFPSLQSPVTQNGQIVGVFPAYGDGLDITSVAAPPPVGWRSPTDAEAMLPFFGKRSAGQSRWIPLGLARVNPGDDPVRLFFGGLEDGRVPHAGSSVALEDPLSRIEELVINKSG